MRLKRHWEDWWVDENAPEPSKIFGILKRKIEATTSVTEDLIFTTKIVEGEAFYTHTKHSIHSMPETVSHRILRSSKATKDPLRVPIYFYNFSKFLFFYNKFVYIKKLFKITYFFRTNMKIKAY